MKGIYKITAIIIGLLLLILIIVASQTLPIISGYGAKNLCSCYYNSGRSVESIIQNELSGFLVKLGSFEINEDSSATGSVFGFAKRKAIFRRGMGCTLLAGENEEMVRAQPRKQFNPKTSSDTLYWPYGELLPDSLPLGINIKKVSQVVEQAFIENNPEKKKNTRAVIVVYDNQIISERYSKEYDKNVPQLGWSMAKSIISGFIGILVKEGKLDIHEPVNLSIWNAEEDPRNKAWSGKFI